MFFFYQHFINKFFKTILAEDEKDFCNSPKNFIDILLDLSTHNVSLKKPPNKIRI